MEHTHDSVYDGKLLHENSYAKRNEKHSQMELQGEFGSLKLYGVVDFFDAKQKVIHETKRSDRLESAHSWQAKFYLWLLEMNDIHNARAILEYPLLRETTQVVLSSEDVLSLEHTVLEIKRIVTSNECPPVINSKICKSCSYYELCYVNEE